MKRVTFTFSINVEDEDRLLRTADRMIEAAWGPGGCVDDYVNGTMTPLLVATVESLLLSNGLPWPDGIADDADVDYRGFVVDLETQK
jgi:hypothetical protein